MCRITLLLAALVAAMPAHAAFITDADGNVYDGTTISLTDRGPDWVHFRVGGNFHIFPGNGERLAVSNATGGDRIWLEQLYTDPPPVLGPPVPPDGMGDRHSFWMLRSTLEQVRTSRPNVARPH